MEITQKEFNKKFAKLPKTIQKDLILKSGIKYKYQSVLIDYYVNELDYISMSCKKNLTSESIGNLLVDARKHLKDNLQIVYLYDKSIQNEISLLL